MAKKSVKEKLASAKATAQEPTAEAKTATVVPTPSQTKKLPPAHGMLFHKENYILMAVGLVLILVGFLLMSGGKSPDPKVFAADELYSFRRITLAPILVLLGFVVEGYAILKKPTTAA